MIILVLRKINCTVRLREIANFYKVPLKYGAYLGLFFWVFGCLVNSNLFNFSNFLILFGVSTLLMLFNATLDLLDKKLSHPRYIRQIRNYPAFIEFEVTRNFKFLQKINSFSGFYRGFQIYLSFNFDEKTEKLQINVYAEKEEQVPAKIRRQNDKLEVTEFGDCVEIMMKRSIPFHFEDLKPDLDKLVELLEESGAKNAVCADSE